MSERITRETEGLAGYGTSYTFEIDCVCPNCAASIVISLRGVRLPTSEHGGGVEHIAAHKRPSFQRVEGERE